VFLKTRCVTFSKFLLPFLTRNKPSIPFAFSQVFFLLSTKAPPTLKSLGSLKGKGSNNCVFVLNKPISPEILTIIVLFLSYLEMKITLVGEIP